MNVTFALQACLHIRSVWNGQLPRGTRQMSAQTPGARLLGTNARVQKLRHSAAYMCVMAMQTASTQQYASNAEPRDTGIVETPADQGVVPASITPPKLQNSSQTQPPSLLIRNKKTALTGLAAQISPNDLETCGECNYNRHSQAYGASTREA